MTVFVKVCGLSRPADVAAAVEAEADAIGFVWWEGSPRHVEPTTARALGERAPVMKVLVTFEAEPLAATEAAREAGVDAVQPHGRDRSAVAEAARGAGFSVIRPVQPSQDLSDIPEDDLLLVDSAGPDDPGGSGLTLDWDGVAAIDRPFLLAGGLGPGNVAEAIRRARPFGVDASSGLEAELGVKDPELIRRFVFQARSA